MIEDKKALLKIQNFIKISESGIDSTVAILELKEYGFKGFLMGEYFMKSENPENELNEFLKKINL